MKLTSWTDVDEAIKQIGLLTIKRDRLEGKLNELVVKAKDQYGPAMEVCDQEVARLGEQLEAWCDAHRADMAQAKQDAGLTWRGLFGKVAFRKCPPAIKLLKKTEKVLAALQARKLTHCIRATEEPNLEAMHMLDDDLLAEIGVRRQPADKFEVKPDYKSIAAKEEA